MTGSVARRYAQALFDLAAEKGLVDQFRQELKGVGRYLESQPEAVAILADPLVAPAKKKALIDQTFPRPIHPLLANLLHLLVDKRRIEHLAEVISAYNGLVDKHLDIVEVQVTSAVALGPGEQAGLVRALEKTMGKHVRLMGAVDEKIMGGLVVRIDDRLYDGSLRTRLDRLRREMARGSLG
ncbi:MAG TPA: F0F1 ATP synthase subunit delta [Bacillota bacterium]